MDFMDLLKSAGGDQSIGELAGAVGLDSADTGKLIGALAPALMSGLQKNTASDDGVAGLKKALQTGGHERYLDNPQLLRDEATRSDGNKILGHLFGSKEVSREVASRVSQQTGVSSDLLKKMLGLQKIALNWQKVPAKEWLRYYRRLRKQQNWYRPNFLGLNQC